MKKIIYCFLILSFNTILVAQPDWTPVIYTNSTTAYGIVTINGNPAEQNDIIGAFVSGECRAAEKIIIYEGKSYVTLGIQGIIIETVYFKFYDASENQIYDLDFSTQTKPGDNIGYPPDYLPLEVISIPTSILTVSPINRDVSSSSGSTTFSISSNVSWIANESESWINSISPTSGSNNGTITVNYSENITVSQRQGTITISGGGLTEQVTITQSAPNITKYLEVSQTNLSLNSSSGKTYVNIASNIEWSISDDSYWIYISPSTGSNDAEITVNYGENTSDSERTGIITIYGEGLTKQIIVTQAKPNNSLLSRPLLFSPQNNSSIYYTDNNYIFLDWDDSENATGYDYEISRNSTFTDIAAQDGCGESEIVVLSYLVPEQTTYYWRIRAKNNSGASEWSETWSFYINKQSSTVVTIADAKIDADNDYIPDKLGQSVVITGIISSNNFLSHNQTKLYLQDNVAGIAIFDNDQVNDFFSIGTKINVRGVVGNYNGEAEIVVSDINNDYSIINRNNAIIPIQLDISTLLSDPELYEGRLVTILNLTKMSNSDDWPELGNSANIMVQNNTGQSLILRIDNDTDIDGYTEPNWPLNITGIISQYTLSEPPNDGYQIMPRFYSDIEQNIVSIEKKQNNKIPSNYYLTNNYPNPFNPSTNISFGLPEQCTVSLIVYDISGKAVESFLQNERLSPGTYNYSFEANNLASGIYFYTLRTEKFIQTKKLLLVK